jgi:branched-chain amino acid transport system substrate-binding protein
MKRFARIAAPVGAVLVALVLAIAASATTSKTDKSASPSASHAVTNYLTYVHGKRGKANPKLPKVYVGWVNQQGGQIVIGGLATAGAQLAVKYINEQLGGVGGRQVVLVQCFIKSAEEEGTTCGQKLLNDKRISVVAEGAVATGAQSLHATIGAAKPIVTGVAITPVNGASKTGVVLFGDGPHILLPFGNYAKNVLHAKTAAVIYPNAPGIAESGEVIAKGLADAGIATKKIGYPQGQTDLTAPLTAVGATTADFIAPYGSAADCANQAKSLTQLGITDSSKIMTAPLCLNQQVIDALGDWSKWTYAIASSLYGDATDKGMPAYNAVIKRYKAEKNAPDPWHIVAFSELLTTVRFLNEARATKAGITPKTVLVRAKAFRGPLALGAPKLQCGKYKDAPAICNDMFQAFTYQGKFAWKRASDWIGPLGS